MRGSTVRATTVVTDITLVKCKFAQRGRGWLAESNHTAKAGEASSLRASANAIEDRLGHHARLNLVVVGSLSRLGHVLDLSRSKNAEIEWPGHGF